MRLFAIAGYSLESSAASRCLALAPSENQGERDANPCRAKRHGTASTMLVIAVTACGFADAARTSGA
jgi:hypothetical protein